MSGSVADGVGASVPIESLLRPEGQLSPALLVVTGPFFLGFALEYLGMGLILVLGIQYLVSLRNEDNRHAPGLEKHSRIGPILVILSLGFNILQLIFDLLRGWNMFAKNFLDIFAFATPDYIWFVSPLLGLFPALITQAFLLRRITLFLSSLSSLWPALDRPAVKMSFVVIMTGAIVMSFLSGCIGSYYIWKSGPLWDDFVRESNVSVSSILHAGSRVADLIWLSTSSAVDIILSMILSFELWWARRKLAAKGGMLAKVTWQLLLVTFHGGVAVTALQLTALFLFEFKRAAAYCYLPILFAPKIYTLTLLLSLTLPQGNKSGHSASHVFSLPTIETSPQYHQNHPQQHSVHHQNPTTSLTHRRSSPSRTTPVLPPLKLGSVAFATASSSKDRDRDRESKDSRGAQRKSAKSGLSSVVAKSWRLSQEWLTWSLLAGDDTLKDTEGDKIKEKVMEKGDRMSTGNGTGSKWKNADQDYAHPPLHTRDERRPSEPNSLAPLLPLTPGSDLSLTYPSLSTAQSLPTGSYPYDQPRTPLHPFHTSSSSTNFGFGMGNGNGNGVTTPEASVTVSRQHSFSTGRSSLSIPPVPTHGTNNHHSQTVYGVGVGGVSSPSLRTKAPTPLVFDTINPFATLPRSRTRSKPLDPIQSQGRLEDEYRNAEAEALSGTAPMSGDGDDDDDDELEPPRRPGTRARLMSFEDMLGGPPPEPRKGSASGSGSGSSPSRWR